MPRPSCAIFSPFFQSPRSLPSAGHLIVARFAFSIRSATSLGSALPVYSLQVFCVSSCTRRSSFAWPCSTNDALSIGGGLGVELGIAGRRRAADEHRGGDECGGQRRCQYRLRCMAWPPSALDRGRVERGAVRIAGKEHGQRDRRVRREDELREALLAEAVVEPPLERAQLALRHAVRRPRRVGLLRAARSA